MAPINVQRVILGGFVAGLVANAFDFVITSYLIAAEFDAMLSRLGVTDADAQSWIGVFAVADFIWGFLLVFTYAAVRPRFGPGPTTAVIAGVVLWLAFAIAMLVLMAMGLHTIASYAKSAALYLVSAIASSVAGASLYQEALAASDSTNKSSLRDSGSQEFRGATSDVDYRGRARSRGRG